MDIMKEAEVLLGLYMDSLNNMESPAYIDGEIMEATDVRLGFFTGNDYKQQVNMQKLDLIRQKAWAYYLFHPLANRRVEAMTSFLLGQGISIESNIDDKLWQNFWKREALPLKLREISNRVQIEGEAFPVLFGNLSVIKLREFSPSEIKHIDTDIEDYAEEIGYLREWNSQSFNRETKQVSSTSRSEYYEKREMIPNGERIIMHWKTLSVPNQTRGFPDLMPMLLPLSRYDNMLNAMIDYIRARAAYIWKLELKGYTDDQLKEEQAKIRRQGPPKAGSIKLTNQNSNIELISGSGGGLNAKDELRAALIQIVAGSGMAEAVLTGDASNGNFSSTREQLKFYLYTLQEYRTLWSYWLTELHDEVMSFRSSEIVSAEETDTCKITFPPVASEDILKLAQSLSLQVAGRFCSKQTAAEEMGRDWEEELKRLQEEGIISSDDEDILPVDDHRSA